MYTLHQLIHCSDWCPGCRFHLAVWPCDCLQHRRVVLALVWGKYSYILWLYVCMYVCMHACMRVCMYVSVVLYYVYVYCIYFTTNIHTSINTYTHSLTHSLTYTHGTTRYFCFPSLVFWKRTRPACKNVFATWGEWCRRDGINVVNGIIYVSRNSYYEYFVFLYSYCFICILYRNNFSF